jgi:MarR family transcriptional regulator for hemolysin
MITAVARNPGATQKKLADTLEVREMTAARLVDRLCEEGYLERRDNPRHHRAYGVHLTSAANPLLGKLNQIAKTHEAATFAGLESEDIEKLDSMLDVIARNLAQL